MPQPVDITHSHHHEGDNRSNGQGADQAGSKARAETVSIEGHVKTKISIQLINSRTDRAVFSGS